MADIQTLENALRNADKAGDNRSAEILTREIMKQRHPTLEQRTQSTLGLDPKLQRSTILPFARTPEGETEFAWPQVGVDLMKAALTPGHVAQGGQVTPEDVTRMAVEVGPLGRMRGLNTPISRGEFIRQAPGAKKLAAESKQVYDAVKAEGIVIPGEDAANLVTGMTERLRVEGATPALHKKVTDLLAEWQTKRQDGSPLEFEELEIMRRQAGGIAKSIDPDTSRLGNVMKEAIDDFIEKMPDKPEIKQARSLWNRKSKVQDIEELFFKAENSASGFENGLRNGFRALLNNRRHRRRFNKAEVAAMQKVVNGGPIQSILRTLRHLGPGMKGENRFLGSAIGAGGGASIGEAIAPGMGTLGAMTALGLGHGAGRLAQGRTTRAGDFAKALAGSGGAPDIDTIARALMRQAPQRAAGPLIGTTFQKPRPGPRQ